MMQQTLHQKLNGLRIVRKRKMNIRVSHIPPVAKTLLPVV